MNIQTCPICATELHVENGVIKSVIDPRAPTKELKQTYPLVLYFDSEAARDEVIAAYQAYNPKLKARRLE